MRFVYVSRHRTEFAERVPPARRIRVDGELTDPIALRTVTVDLEPGETKRVMLPDGEVLMVTRDRL